ncbi:MAG TPA: hypothetical protein VFP97_06500 [Chitinophagaceae bacterium]|nr:hypothetical protein [Chitinophagaceae bacterium]
MRRTLSAIFLISVFVSLQFGKVASYIYCKWQAEIVQNIADCGCDDHLTSMFDHKDDTSKSDQSKLTLKEKLNEFTPKGVITVSQVFIAFEQSFAEYDSSLSENFIESPFHPPIA